MKKILLAAAILTLCLCFAETGLGVHASAEHTHNWKMKHDWEYHWQVCTECGEVKEKEVHYIMCDAKQPYRCVVCDLAYEDGKATMYQTHYISENSVRIDTYSHALVCDVCQTMVYQEPHRAACIAPDLCLECGKRTEDGIVISEVLHLWALTGGETSHWEECLLCGETRNEAAHYVSCVSETPDVCSGCGMSKADGAVLEIIGHNYPEDSVKHDQKNHWFVCADCGRPSEPEAHRSSCGDPYSCCVCYATVYDGAEVPYTEHTWEIQWDSVSHQKRCAVCQAAGSDYEFHYFYCDAEDQTVCAFCSRRLGDISLLNEKHRSERKGYDSETHFTVCDACGKILDRDSHRADCSSPDACQICGARKADGAVYEVEHDPDYYNIPYNTTHHWIVCERCGDTLVNEPHRAFCESPDRCIVCNAWTMEGDAIETFVHRFTTRHYDEEKHWEICDHCGAKASEEKHQFNEMGFCSVCGCPEPSISPQQPVFSLENVRYNGKAVTGVLAQKPPAVPYAGTLNVRVTFFIAGNYYMGTVGEVEQDGSFYVEGVGPIEYISLLASGSDGTRYDTCELFISD